MKGIWAVCTIWWFGFLVFLASIEAPTDMRRDVLLMAIVSLGFCTLHFANHRGN